MNGVAWLEPVRGERVEALDRCVGAALVVALDDEEAAVAEGREIREADPSAVLRRGIVKRVEEEAPLARAEVIAPDAGPGIVSAVRQASTGA